MNRARPNGQPGERGNDDAQSVSADHQGKYNPAQNKMRVPQTRIFNLYQCPILRIFYVAGGGTSMRLRLCHSLLLQQLYAAFMRIGFANNIDFYYYELIPGVLNHGLVNQEFR